jgi:hypothetical protein
MKANIPKSWVFLPEKEKKIIAKMMEDEVNKTIDHEEAELQKRWLQLACIVLHRQKDPFGKTRCLAFLNGFKRIYKKCKRFNSEREIKEWVDKELEHIFGSGGYPSEWVDNLGNG